MSEYCDCLLSRLFTPILVTSYNCNWYTVYSSAISSSELIIQYRCDIKITLAGQYLTKALLMLPVAHLEMIQSTGVDRSCQWGPCSTPGTPGSCPLVPPPRLSSRDQRLMQWPGSGHQARRPACLVTPIVTEHLGIRFRTLGITIVSSKKWFWFLFITEP